MKGPAMSDRKVALITGASRGIGAATAIEFARRGYDVALTGLDATSLNSIAEQARAHGATAHTIAGDLEDMSFVESLVDRFVASLGRIDVLVNNAAWRELLTMRQISLESWEKTLRICLTAPAFLAKATAVHMERQKRGVIVNVSSIMSSRASGIAPAYVASKGAMDALTYDLAALYGPSGIRVVAVNPGAVDTALSNDYSAATDQSGFEKRMRDWSEQMIPLRRWATPQEIGRTIVAICSDDASYLTGTTITLDGGWSHQFWPYGLKHEQHPDQFP
jgi:NAD(P)-dependent dehydrogenase (short-subunit alcohol dehydrogenase family)